MGMTLVLHNRCYPFKVITGKSLEYTFIPFMIDSDLNVGMENAFLTSDALTRYICTGCEKYVVWVGECGQLNHDFTIEEYKERG